MLFMKMLRDIRHHKTQFVSIFIMAILGVFVYAGINAEWYGMEKSVTTYYEETKLPDLWLMSTAFTQADMEAINQLSAIEKSSMRLMFEGVAGLENRPTLRILVLSDTNLSIPKVLEGAPFDLKRDGIWLDADFAKANNLEVGEKLAIEVDKMSVQKEILGLIMHPEFVHNVKDASEVMPNPETFGYVLTTRTSLPQLTKILNNQLLLKSDLDKLDKTKQEIERLFGDRFIQIIDRTSHPSVAMFQGEIDQNKAMGGVFPVVFFTIAALTMLSTMTRLTSNQRTQIGILKALGFSKRKILSHYVSYGIWIGLVGGLIGLVTGPLVIPNMLIPLQKTTYSLPAWLIRTSPSALVAVGIGVLCCGLSSYYACAHQLKEVPAETLKAKVPRVTKHTSLEKSKWWIKSGFVIQWNLRDVLRSKTRSLMAVIGVMGCTGLLLFGFGLNDSVNQISHWMYDDLYTYQRKMILEADQATNSSYNQTKEAITEMTPTLSGQWIEEHAIEIQTDKGTTVDKITSEGKLQNLKETGTLTILGEGNQIRYENKSRHTLTMGAWDVGISYKMAQLLSVQTGDTIKWRAFGEKVWYDVVITKIYRTPMEQGLVLGKAAYEQLGQAFQPTAFLTSQTGLKASDFPGVEQIENISESRTSFDEMMESMKMIVAILVLAAIILGSVVLYNLGVLSFLEKNREFATLRVLGFETQEIRKLMLVQNTWLTVIGIILGIPAGLWLIGFMLSTMSKSLDMVSYISIPSLLIGIIGTFAVSMLVSVGLSFKVKGIDMVSSLKSVE